MGNVERNGQELSACQQYQTLLAVSEAIVSHRDLATLFHDLAGRLHLVVRFDYLACVLHDATSNTMPLPILETTEPIPARAPRCDSVEESLRDSSWRPSTPDRFQRGRGEPLAAASGAGEAVRGEQ